MCAARPHRAASELCRTANRSDGHYHRLCGRSGMQHPDVILPRFECNDAPLELQRQRNLRCGPLQHLQHKPRTCPVGIKRASVET